MFLNGTSVRLRDRLLEFLNWPDFMKVEYRQNLQFLADDLECEGWVAMSLEEVIVRNHYDYLGVVGEPQAGMREVFQHERLLMMLGRVGNHPKLSRPVVEKAIKKLIEAKILVSTSASDGQAGFPSTELYDSKWTIGRAVFEVRKRINENRT